MAKIYREWTQDALDTAFNARDTVEDFDAVLNGMARASARAEAAIPGPRDVPYGPHCDELLDIFPAGGQQGNAPGNGSPVHLFIHGGYWRLLTKDDNSFAANALAPAGATVLVNSYSLAPAVKMDVIVRQCRAAVVWAYRNAAAYGADPEKLFISGHSAGGHLVAMLLATDWEVEYGLPNDIIKGATTISGLFDLRPIKLSFVNEWLELTDSEAERNSPILHPTRVKCPVVVTHGGGDPEGFHIQSREYLAHLEANGNPVTFVDMTEFDHFSACHQITKPESPLTKAILAQMGL